MKKQTIIKIISKMIVFVFLLCFILPITPINAATTPSMSSLYSNPNQNVGNNPYKFKVSDVVNGSMLTSVIGCTGVVNTVSKWMSSLLQSSTVKENLKEKARLAAIDQVKSACKSGKASSETAAQSIPFIGGLAVPIDTILSKLKIKIDKTSVQTCLQSVDAINLPEIDKLTKQLEQDKTNTIKEQCFDGIAITLAKNQLTAMARSTMNWVNSGYGGNPFFVQNMQNLTYNIEKNVVETGIDVLLAPQNASPYAADFARTTINSQGIMANSSKFLGGLQSDLSNFISSPTSYYTNDQLNGAQDTRTALQRAQQANDAFAKDFSLGGWNGWLALTQRENNNPLGYNMIASQYLSDMQNQVVSNQKAEIAQNNGFMSQKQCIEWQQVDKNGDLMYEDDGSELKTQSAKNMQRMPNVCINEKVITPGSLIKDKVGNYLNSPDRQLELVKTINDGLNVLFSALISKLQSGGLTSLSDSAVATNWKDNMNTLTGGSSNTGTGSTYNNNGAYDNFNLTRDLGNTYIHTATTNLGTWNANTNSATLSSDANKTYPKDINNSIGLYPNTAPEVYTYNSDTQEKELAYPNNPFYTVTVAGKSKLMIDGYNGWEVGDRAFWDGNEWQNWKNGQQSPIAKRGVIQLQQDYIVAAKEILGVLPNVMTSLGELDYCLPGPNPSYKTNSTDAQSAYQDWNGSMYVGAIDTSNQRFGVKIDKKGDRTYDALEKIYADNQNAWNAIRLSMEPLIQEFSMICSSGNGIGGTNLNNGGVIGTIIGGPVGGIIGNLLGGGGGCGTSSYFYTKDMSKEENDRLVQKQDVINATLDKVNNHLFQDFYDVFDKMMNKIYFNNMTSQYLDTETSISVDKNPSYVPMAQSGFDLTKDILYYNDETSQKIQDYNDAITQANINITKLKPIRDEVSGIIQAAQKRRDDNLVKILNDEATRTGGKVLTKAQYDAKYASCIKEEDIQVFDADGILGRGSKAKENCTDGIDNDLNGLTDANDPACKGIVN